MKSVNVLLALAAVSALGVGCTTSKTACTGCCDCVVPAGASTPVNAKTADALTAALQDERRVQVFYRGVLAKQGQVKPFVNIVNAEERHENVIASLMKRHGVAVPAGDPGNVPPVPATFAECNRVAAQLERDNIAMYDRFLTDVTDPDVRSAFENLRAASKNNHLPAFERWSADAGAPPTTRGVAMGYGFGRGAGRGWACGVPCTLTP